MEQTITHPPLYYLLRPPPSRRRWRDGRATGSAQRATGVRIARHRRTVSDMQWACQSAPTRSLTAGVRTGEGRGSIGTSPPESKADARGNSRAWRQSLFARPSADGRVAALGTPRREDATWAIVGQPVANGRVGKPRWAARFPAPPTCLAELPTCRRIIQKCWPIALPVPRQPANVCHTRAGTMPPRTRRRPRT
jgi:hypothetical protein